MINVVIYSKDRAMQLEACLQTLKKHFKEYEQAKKTVIYKATSIVHRTAYSMLIEGFQNEPNIEFVGQNHFKNDTVAAIHHANPYTMFVMDDILFKDDFSLSDAPFTVMGPQTLAVSLRLHKGISYCYATDKSSELPQFVRDVPGQLCVWNYIGKDGDWGYGYSLDANVFLTNHILPAVSLVEYHTPNQLEAMLNIPRPVGPQYMSCYPDGGKLVNYPANRVQTDYPNRFEQDWDQDTLADMFMDGKRIDITDVPNVTNNAVHYPVDLKFKP